MLCPRWIESEEAAYDIGFERGITMGPSNTGPTWSDGAALNRRPPALVPGELQLCLEVHLAILARTLNSLESVNRRERELFCCVSRIG